MMYWTIVMDFEVFVNSDNSFALSRVHWICCSNDPNKHLGVVFAVDGDRKVSKMYAVHVCDVCYEILWSHVCDITNEKRVRVNNAINILIHYFP